MSLSNHELLVVVIGPIEFKFRSTCMSLHTLNNFPVKLDQEVADFCKNDQFYEILI